MDTSMEVDVVKSDPDSSDLPDLWLRKYFSGCSIDLLFKKHWRTAVPRAFAHMPEDPCHEWITDEEYIQKYLIHPLEEFMCNKDYKRVYDVLSTSEKASSVCGKVFKIGEPTYNCRECCTDVTCVLCVDCFKQSVHKNHKYKMGTSGGGGCCDCGDVEAWKTSPFCKTHNSSKKDVSIDDSDLPSGLAERSALVLTATLKYAFQLLTLDHSPGLPADLRFTEEDDVESLETSDTYCTVLYNDETHTFEQVITTLSRVLKCSHKDAIEFVTHVDRDGRSVVHCSTYDQCIDVRSEIERFTSRHGTRPLKVAIVHSHVLSHQMHALKLLTWIQSLMGVSKFFRNIFCRVACASEQGDASVIEGVLLRDSLLWKNARLHWHRLFISAMFMDYESKKMFSRIFTKNYGSVMKDFIRDDHDHSFSIASLGVQIFTVPSLAHYLIAHEDVIFKLMNTFMSECSRKCNRAGKLEFDKSIPNGSFKRAMYILYDVRYILSVPCPIWTDALRKGFLQGLSLVLTLLLYMQGMDTVTRQVGQHMEYEPEWESAFNLHIKLATVITMILKWCSTDKIVLIKAYRLTLKKLYESYDTNQSHRSRELVDHCATCIVYDVATRPVTIHLPLSRFFAGLHLHLEKYGLSFDSPEFAMSKKLSPEQIIEPVLRTQVMIAQVHAGMWRRNGYSLSNQIYFYHNVRCRGEMLDKDIVLLQLGASLIESNEFLVHALNKFGLIEWVDKDFETTSTETTDDDFSRQIVSLVEEFLSLIITIVGERYVPGVGNITGDDAVKKEIIQQLCIRPLSHSELNKTLPDDVNHETGMEKVIHEVAEFKKPSSGSGKGVYMLKPELVDQYNVFFYHYTKEELSKSEEEQRKARKATRGLECCPPPNLPQFTETFSMVANLIQCDVMLLIMSTILTRCKDWKARSFSDNQFQKVLHLIGYALNEESSNHSNFFAFTTRAEKWGIKQLLEDVVGNPRIEAHEDLLQWVLNKYRTLLTPSTPESMDVGEPSSFDVKTSEEQEKSDRAKLAAERRAKIMAQMAALQNNFMKDNAALFEEAMSTSEKDDSLFMVCDDEASASVDRPPVALGLNQTPASYFEKTITCILCQEEQVLSVKGPPLVLAAFVQKSTVLCRSRKRNIVSSYITDDDLPFLSMNLGPSPHTSSCGHVMHGACWQKYFDNVLAKENRRPYRMRTPSSFEIEKNEYLCPLCECLSNTVLPLMPPVGAIQIHKTNESTECLNFPDWLEASKIATSHKKKMDKSLSSATGSSDTPKESEDNKEKKNSEGGARRVSLKIDKSNLYMSSSSDDEDLDEPLLKDEDNLVKSKKVVIGEGQLVMQLKIYGGKCEKNVVNNEPIVSKELLDMIFFYAQATYTKGLGVNPHDDDERVPLMTWMNCAYTIHSMEWLLRFQKKPLLGSYSCRQKECLENMIRVSAILGHSWKRKNVINKYGMKLMEMVADNKVTHPSLMDWDSFGVLVPMIATIPSVFYPDPVPLPSGSRLESHAVLLMLYSTIAQIMVNYYDTTSEPNFEEESTEMNSDKILSTLFKLLKQCYPTNPSAMWEHIKENTLPYLRCCCIYFHFLADVPPPKTLTEIGSDTFESLCSYLDIPSSCSELLGHRIVYDLFSMWVSHPKVQKIVDQGPTFRNLSVMNELVKLPDDYSELINAVSVFTCPNSDREDSRNPTMCLVCGQMLCSQTYCCQTELNKVLVSAATPLDPDSTEIPHVGACTFHAFTCGAGVGMFLRIRESEVLLLATPSRGCFMSPPYLDDYGETDQGLRRGNPLHLSIENYQKLQYIWLSHGIYEEIARAIESSHNLINTQWQHL